MATSEVPDRILVDQLSHLIEQVGIIGRRNSFDHVSKYNVSMLVCKAAALGNDILLLPIEQRANILKYLGMIKRNHGDCLDIVMHRRINSVMVAVTLLSVKSTDKFDVSSAADARGSNEVTGSDLFASKASKEMASSGAKLKSRNSATATLKGSRETSSSVVRSRKEHPQKGDVDGDKLLNERPKAGGGKAEVQPGVDAATMDLYTGREEENAKTVQELMNNLVRGLVRNTNGNPKKERKLIAPERLMDASSDDWFHVSRAECVFAAETFGERFVKREMVIPKSLTALIFGRGDEVAAMIEVLTNTIISLKPSEDCETWQHLAIAGRYKQDVDKSICFIHFLLKYQIKMDFAELVSLCCKFREADKPKEKQTMHKGMLYKGRKPLTYTNQGMKTLLALKGKALPANIVGPTGRPGTPKSQDELNQHIGGTKAQLEIPNKAVGKIMGNRGCIVAIIESLSKAVISFQRTLTDKEKRTLHLKADRQQDLNCAQELIKLTLEHGIRFGLLTEMLYWGKKSLHSRSFRDLADNMSMLPYWESRGGKCYQDVWMPEGRRNIRQLLFRDDRHLKGPPEKSIKLHMPSTASMRRLCVAKDSVGIQPKSSPFSSSMKKKDALNGIVERRNPEKPIEEGEQECHPNLICKHDNLMPALQRANFLMAALDTSSTSDMDGNCQLLCEILQLNRRRS